jgi:hypothetical protein
VSGAKKVKVDEMVVVENAGVNVEFKVNKIADVTEKEGTAVLVLLCLSKL